MRVALLPLLSFGAAFAAIDLPAGSGWGPSSRVAAMGHPVWTDSAVWNLFDAAGHSSVLAGEFRRPVELRAGSRGLGADGSGAKLSQNEVAALHVRGGSENKMGYRADLGWTSQSLSVAEGLPVYEAGRLRWGFDLGSSFGADRLVSIGFGLRGRIPSTQTQDTSGVGGAPGDFERLQWGVEALRLGMAFHIARTVTLAGRIEGSGDLDTLKHTTSVAGLRSLHRYAVVRLPIVGFSAQLKREELPVEALGDVTFGTVHRFGVMKTIGDAATGIDGSNVDFPKLVGDSLRILAAVRGRWGRDGHVVHPVLAFEHASLRTQAYEPVKGTSDPFAGGAALADTGWNRSRQTAVVGVDWAWDRGVAAQMELLTAKQNLTIDPGLGLDDESHTDLGMSLGLELSHKLVPAWKEKIPAGQEYFVRLGWERRSLCGSEIEPGFLGGLTTGYEEPATGYPNQNVTGDRFGWRGQESEVGLTPTLGGGADLNRFTWGLGASFLDGGLVVDAGLQHGTWTPDGGKDLSLFGWAAEVRWSP